MTFKAARGESRAMAGNEGKEVNPAGILALQGSPRRGGNTDRLLDRTLEAAARRGAGFEKIVLRDLNVSPCLEITDCMKTGHCAIQDEMTVLYEKLTSARVVIAVSPIFFYGPSAQLKTIIDRCQALWARKYVLKQNPPGSRGRGYLISAAATQGRKLFDGLLLTSRYFFDVLNLDFSGQVLIRGVDEKGAVDRRPDALALAWAMGEEIGDYLVKPVS